MKRWLVFFAFLAIVAKGAISFFGPDWVLPEVVADLRAAVGEAIEGLN